MADVNEASWKESRVRKDIEGIREFSVDVRLRERLVENNIKAFDRLEMVRRRQ